METLLYNEFVKKNNVAIFGLFLVSIEGQGTYRFAILHQNVSKSINVNIVNPTFQRLSQFGED